MECLFKTTGFFFLALLSTLLLQTQVFSCLAQGNVHSYDFVLKDTNFTKLCCTKSVFAVNDSFPGPVIRAQKGDTVYVNVYNQGRYGVTMHWHGIKQPRNPWFDGPEYITQCPIQPGTNFTYKILLSSEEGTLFWHAHSDWSRATVHGAFLILPANGTSYPFPKPDEEQVIVFASWYKDDVMTLLDETLESGGLTTSSDSYVINGEPGDFYSCSKETTYRMSVDYGKTYLLRIVNSVQNIDMFFAIADHNLILVGMDGSYVKPIVSSYIMITPGQTMDVLVTANKSLGHYYMFASPYYDGEADDFDKSIASAIFQYNGNYTPPSSPIYPTNIPGFYDIGSASNFVKQFRSLASAEHSIDVPLNVTTRMFVTVSIGMLHCPNRSCAGPEGNRISSGLNNISFANPSVDVLQAYYRNISGYYDASFPDEPPYLFNFTAEELKADNYSITDRGTKVKMLNYNATVEITFQGTNVMDSAENHPVHLHGFRFYVIGSGLGNFDNVTDPLTYNLFDPPEVNTFSVPKDGWATIRFIANNPVFDYGATVECVIQGTSLVTGIDHPKRLHGFNFYVVGRRFGNFDQDKDPLCYNLIDPPHKNTVTVPIRGWVVIRFQANNPGKNISKEVRS
ncbi:laccase-14-like [Pyrus ussuriensis x Pyrus communis]|uniref:Laccase n=1 Tax=Pyrus ussuriensis x Pyrus communis TaxID=2448454 RepID=A0A5N5ICB5_9ROSA|nr:laccase-14-like [Pyrus ussuriensis x Pyrus communis]